MYIKRSRPAGNGIGTKRDKSLLVIIIVEALLLLLMLTQAFPLLWIAYSSLKPAHEIDADMLAFPKSIEVSNYDPRVWENLNVNVPIFFRNSLIVTSVSLIMVISISILGAYSIAKIRVPGKKLIVVVLIVLMGIQQHAIAIPVYHLIGDLGLLNKFLGLILVYCAAFSPFATMLLQAYFRDFPNEIIEAAEIDGSSRFRTLVSIVVPNSLGSIASVLVVSFLHIWNEYIYSLIILKRDSVKTLSVGISGFKGAWITEWGPMFAGMFIALLPSILFYALFHKYIMRGMMGGSFKQ